MSAFPSLWKEPSQASGSLLDCNRRIRNQLTQPGHFLARASVQAYEVFRQEFQLDKMLSKAMQEVMSVDTIKVSWLLLKKSVADWYQFHISRNFLF